MTAISKSDVFRFFVAFFIISLFGQRTIAQTAIVIIKVESGIIIAADSKGLKNNNPRDTVSICKIRPIHNIFYGAAGLVFDPITKFDFYEIVDTTYSSENSMAVNFEKSIKVLKTSLPKTLMSIRDRNPIEFSKKFDRKNRIALQIFFAGVENDTLKIYKSNLQFKGQMEYSINSITKSCIAFCDMIYFFGNDSAMVAYHDRYGNNMKESWASYARRLIDIAAKNDPKEVGGAINVLVIHKTGIYEWIDPKPPCADQ